MVWHAPARATWRHDTPRRGVLVRGRNGRQGAHVSNTLRNAGAGFLTTPEVLRLQAELRALCRRVGELEAGLREFGEHHHGCRQATRRLLSTPCDCGLDALHTRESG